jgi:hypothetical protein
VRDYLVQSGIKSERVIAARGFGESKPVADNDMAAGRQVNRRVEIIIADHPLKAHGMCFGLPTHPKEEKLCDKNQLSLPLS